MDQSHTSDTFDSERLDVCGGGLKVLALEIVPLDEVNDVQKSQHAREFPFFLVIHWARHDTGLVHDI